jgi:hypothetical protein
LKNGGYEETICSTLIKILETLKDNFKFHFKVKKARRAQQKIDFFLFSFP